MPAAIDLGSNSILLTVIDASGEVVHDESRVVGLGKGLGDGGQFAPDRIEAALEALTAYATTAAGLGVPAEEVRIVATSAARRATNVDTFVDRVYRETGLRIRVIPGDEEARLTWRGALSGLPVEGTTLVVDLGGGSTELAYGKKELEWRHSYEIGSVRLTERVLGDPIPVADGSHLAAMQDRATQVFRKPRLPGSVDRVIGVAGSVTTLMAAALGQTSYDATAIHGARLTDAMLAGFQERLIGLDRRQRATLFAVAPKRADYMLAGATVLRAALAVAGTDAMVVSARGIRFGVLAD